MASLFSRRLEVRLAIIVGVGLLFFALIAGIVTYQSSYRNHLAKAVVLQEQLVSTVLNQAEVAAYAGNRQIADGVIDGLLGNPAIAAAQIDAEHDFKISKNTNGKPDFSKGRIYPLHSPVYKNEQIGNLVVVQDDVYVGDEAERYAFSLTLVMLIQVVIAAVLMVVVLRFAMTRPVVRLAEAILEIEPGNARRVTVSGRHTHDEIGLLANSANALLHAAEEAIREERTARVLLETTGKIAHIGGWTFNVESRVLTWTKELYAIHERDPTQKITLNDAADYFSAESRQEFLLALDNAIDQGTAFDLELQLTTEGGQTRMTHVQGQPEMRGGKTSLVFGAIQDISERKRVENALFNSEERLRTITDNASTLMFLKDKNGRYLHVNRQFEKLFHLANVDILGKTDHDIFSKDMADLYREADLVALRSGKALELEEQALLDDGLHTYLSVKIPVRDSNGEIYAVCGISTNITERKRIEAELIEAKQTAENASIAKTRILAATSHDLRQPLQAMGLFAMALSKTELSQDQRQLTDNLAMSIYSLRSLVNTLLEMSKLDAGVVKACPEEITTEELFQRIDAQFSALVNERHLRFKFHYPERGITLFTDMELLMMILGNLVGNAIKYTERGSILVSMRRRGDRALIQIWDTGVGIAPEHLGDIFEEYYQVGNTARDGTQGLGLGLSIVKRQAALLNSKVSCRSRPGKGSVFTLSLPLLDEARAGGQSRLLEKVA